MDTYAARRAHKRQSGSVAVPFSTYPRRVVRAQDGGASLVLIRRWVPAKFTLWNYDVRWELQHLWRAVRRDHRWSVEWYRGESEDPGGTPRDPPSRRWIVASRSAAEEFAETLCGAIAKDGAAARLPEPRGTDWSSPPVPQ